MDDRPIGVVIAALALILGLLVAGRGLTPTTSDGPIGAAASGPPAMAESAGPSSGPPAPSGSAPAGSPEASSSSPPTLPPGSPAGSPAGPGATPMTSPTPTLIPTPSPIPTPAPTPDPAAPVRAFYEVFAAAIRSGDAATLVTLLHPAVIDRYGADSCRSNLAQLADPSYVVVVVAVHDPEPWGYARDWLSTTIPNARAVDVEVTAAGATSAAVFHVAEADGGVRWFADCGVPIEATPSP